MQKVRTPILGISTKSNYEDGTTCSLVNLRPKNGALHPVAPRKVMQELSQSYDIVFVHQNNDYQNWLGVVNSGTFSSVYWDIRNENPENITYNIQGEINSVQQIGNTISLLTDDNIYYLFYQNGRYIFLGEIPQIPMIGFGIHSQTHAEYYFINEYGEGTVNPGNFIDSTKGLVNKAMEILMHGGTDRDGNPIGGYGLQLFDACFVRYAFRLYDDTLTKHSPPILVMPMRHIVGKEEEGNLDSIKTISYDFDSALRKDSKVDIYGHRIYMRYNLEKLGGDNHEIWKDIIKSVDVFMSPPIGISNIENIRNDLPTSNSPRTLNYNLVKGLSSEALKNAANTSTFYFVRSLSLGSVTGFEPDPLPSQESDFTRMENLIFQEQMSDDNFSNHKYGAAKSYVYNNRLHLGDIKTTFFKGFHPGYFRWENSYNAMDPSDEKVEYMAAEVEIHTGTSLEKVYSFFSEQFSVYKLFTSAFLSYPDPRAKRITIYEVTNNVWTRVFTAPLEPHSFLNLAYYLNEGLEPVTGIKNSVPITAPDTSKVITRLEPNKIKVSDLDNPLRFPNINTYQVGNGSILAMASNAIRISEGQFGQFPLYVFTTQGIYSLDVGSGEVVYSNKSAPTSYEVPTTPIVTSTPFGVVFTSARGVCIIRGQEVELLTPQLQQPPEALQVEFLKQMEGVVHQFPNKPFADYLRDIDSLVYDPYENELIICDKESDFNYVLNLYSQSFYQSTERIGRIVQNTFPELYVVDINKLKDYKEGNLNEDGTVQRVNISFVTRPLQYGMPYIKWLERMQLFCKLYDANPVVYISHSSMDGINFNGMSGRVPSKRGNYSTLDTGTIAGNKFRDFLFAFGATVAPESVINYLESWIGAEYKDQLMK